MSPRDPKRPRAPRGDPGRGSPAPANTPPAPAAGIPADRAPSPAPPSGATRAPGGSPASWGAGAGPLARLGTAEYAELADEILVGRAQGGDSRAFDELVRRYREKVYRLSFKILRHEGDAAEALQDAFLSAFRGLKNFKAESTFSTWLYRIATNASLMKYRKRRDDHVSLEQSQSRNADAEALEVPDWSTQPVDELLNAELRVVMQDARDRLPEELRTVFVLRDEEGLSNADVAETLDLSVAAVKSRLHRARLSLRDRLNRYFADRMTQKDRVP